MITDMYYYILRSIRVADSKQMCDRGIGTSPPPPPLHKKAPHTHTHTCTHTHAGLPPHTPNESIWNAPGALTRARSLLPQAAGSDVRAARAIRRWRRSHCSEQTPLPRREAPATRRARGRTRRARTTSPDTIGAWPRPPGGWGGRGEGEGVGGGG